MSGTLIFFKEGGSVVTLRTCTVLEHKHKIPAIKVATLQSRDSLVETFGRSGGEEFPIRSTTSTLQIVSEQGYQTRSASGIKGLRKMKDYFLFKDNDSEEKFDNDVIFFEKRDTTKCRGHETHIETCI